MARAVSSASRAEFTIGSPRRLNDVLSTTGASPRSAERLQDGVEEGLGRGRDRLDPRGSVHVHGAGDALPSLGRGGEGEDHPGARGQVLEEGPVVHGDDGGERAPRLAALVPVQQVPGRAALGGGEDATGAERARSELRTPSRDADQSALGHERRDGARRIVGSLGPVTRQGRLRVGRREVVPQRERREGGGRAAGEETVHVRRRSPRGAGIPGHRERMYGDGQSAQQRAVQRAVEEEPAGEAQGGRRRPGHELLGHVSEDVLDGVLDPARRVGVAVAHLAVRLARRPQGSQEGVPEEAPSAPGEAEAVDVDPQEPPRIVGDQSPGEGGVRGVRGPVRGQAHRLALSALGAEPEPLRHRGIGLPGGVGVVGVLEEPRPGSLEAPGRRRLPLAHAVGRQDGGRLGKGAPGPRRPRARDGAPPGRGGPRVRPLEATSRADAWRAGRSPGPGLPSAGALGRTRGSEAGSGGRRAPSSPGPSIGSTGTRPRPRRRRRRPLAGAQPRLPAGGRPRCAGRGRSAPPRRRTRPDRRGGVRPRRRGRRH